MSQKILPMSFKDCVAPFIVGGLLIGITVTLTKYMSARAGAIFYAFPLGFVISILFLYSHPERISEFSKEVVPAGICIFAFVLIFYLVFKNNDKQVLSSLLITTLLWLLVATVVFRLSSHVKLEM